MLDTTVAATSDAHNRADHLGCHCNSPRTGWIVATTHSQAERWADANLNRRGYQTYLPLVLRPRRDRVLPTLVHHVLAPLWSGYIFVHHDSRDSWRPIYETPGVRSVLRNRDQIQFAPDAAVSALQASEATRRSQQPDSHQWAPGALVAPANGIFQGMPAVILSIARDTARIGLMFLGQLREITMPIECLKARDDV